MKNNQQSLSKINWSKTALIIVDMQEAFISVTKEIIPKLKKLIETCQACKVPVIWTQHGHRSSENDGGQIAKKWGNNALIMRGSKEWELMKEFQSYEKEFLINSKTRYDAFFGTELETCLKSLGIKTLIIGGTLTNLCCENTARTAFNKDFEVLFLKDGTAAESETMHNATLMNLEYGYASIVKVDEIVDSIKQSKKRS